MLLLPINITQQAILRFIALFTLIREYLGFPVQKNSKNCQNCQLFRPAWANLLNENENEMKNGENGLLRIAVQCWIVHETLKH